MPAEPPTFRIRHQRRVWLLHKAFISTSPIPEPLYSALLVPPRLIVGLGIALGFGVPKISGFDTYLEEARKSGAPAPMILALVLLVVEILGGLALALGYATRPAGTVLALAMTGLLLIPGQRPLPWDVTPFLVGGYFFAVLGGGRYSLDGRFGSSARSPLFLPADGNPMSVAK